MPRKRAADTADDLDSEQAIEVHLDTLLAERGMTLTELSELVGITLVNLSVLKNAGVITSTRHGRYVSYELDLAAHVRLGTDLIEALLR